MDAQGRASRRTDLDATLLALAGPGAGQLYVGRARAAIVVFAALLATQLAVMAAVLLDANLLTATAIALTFAVAVQVFAVFDARRSARSLGDQYRLRPYNRAGVYFAWIIAVAVILGGTNELLRHRFVETWKVPSGSMSPNFEIGDHFLATKLARDRAPRRGDLVVFPYPEDPSEIFFKRVIGLPGDELRISIDRVEIGGVPLARVPCDTSADAAPTCFVETTPEGRSYRIAVPRLPAAFASEPSTFVVPPGHVFVVGDSRGQSHDSTVFGPVPIDSLIGRVRLIWFPFERAATVDG